MTRVPQDVQIIGISSESDKTIKVLSPLAADTLDKSVGLLRQEQGSGSQVHYRLGHHRECVSRISFSLFLLFCACPLILSPQVEGIPAAFVIDKKGIVAWQGHPMSDMEQVT